MMESIRVKVVCDNKRHARGKIATLVEYAVQEDGTVDVVRGWRVKQMARDEKRRKRALAEVSLQIDLEIIERHRPVPEEFSKPFELPALRERISEAQQQVRRDRDWEKRRCKLCGSRLPADVAKVHEAIRKHARHAGSGSVSLAALVAIIDRQERH